MDLWRLIILNCANELKKLNPRHFCVCVCGGVQFVTLMICHVKTWQCIFVTYFECKLVKKWSFMYIYQCLFSLSEVIIDLKPYLSN